MSKLSRFIILLVVLAVCFVCLYPSIKWYMGTPSETQNVARQSLEKIRDKANEQANATVDEIKKIADEDQNAVLDEQKYGWVCKMASREYKKAGEKVSASGMTALAAKRAYASKAEMVKACASHYREEYLAAKKCYANSVKLGLDLAGGINVIVRADLDKAVADRKAELAAQKEANPDADDSFDEISFRKSVMAQAVETLSQSIDTFGLSEPVIRQSGDDHIYIEIPGATQSDSIKNIIEGKASLKFALSDEVTSSGGPVIYPEKPSKVPADEVSLGFFTKDDYGIDMLQGYINVKKEAVIDGTNIKKAEVTIDSINGQPEIDFTLDNDGSDKFYKATSENKGKVLAIISGDKVKSAPKINDPISSRGKITGFNLEEANNLQKLLQSAYLTVPLTVESEQVIGASLGKIAIAQGEKAIIVGLLLIMIFMLAWYKGAGINAIVAQILNFYIMFSVLSAFNLTLSLSSIAGMVLTIGMAVDANVIIFERIKEELTLGKSREASITAGFDNALWSILDSNITTFIAAVFLAQLGTGTIQGFAVSLAIGVISSVFTALFVSRLMFDFNTDTFKSTKVSISWRI